MRPLADAIVVFICVFASGLLGLSLRGLLPERHLAEDSMGMVRLGTGVLATLTALVLGLLVASAKANYDRVRDDITKGAVSILLLDRTLAQYGEQARDARTELRAAVTTMVNNVFVARHRGASNLDSAGGMARSERLQTELRNLTPQNDMQRMLQARALDISNDIAQTRLLVINEAQGSLPAVFLLVLVLWLAIMFAGFGLVTARNPTVLVTLALCALSLAGAVMMAEELNQPLTGFMHVSDAPLRYALANLGN
jgi:hypothetical protein